MSRSSVVPVGAARARETTNPAGRATRGAVRSSAFAGESSTAARRRQAAASVPTPVTVAAAALLLWPHRRHLTPEERRVLAYLLSEGVCATAGDGATFPTACNRTHDPVGCPAGGVSLCSHATRTQHRPTP